MSRYLIRRIEGTPNIEIRTNTRIVALEGTDSLEGVTWQDGAGALGRAPPAATRALPSDPSGRARRLLQSRAAEAVSERSGSNAKRNSAANSSGYSQAAKCPPRSTSWK